jgi:hypothetical protein
MVPASVARMSGAISGISQAQIQPRLLFESLLLIALGQSQTCISMALYDIA